ncbi:MAG: response regulator transcription factor [Bacteroidetes bacterium]|nr:response regulator transcription factor [Bacteroidota bacterium]
MKIIKILLVEDHKLVREAWHSTLSLYPNIKIIGEADNNEDAFNLTKNLLPDIIIMDINLKGESAVDGIKNILNKLAKPKIIIVSMQNDIVFVKKMFVLGVLGYVTKNSSKNELIDSINRVFNGSKYICNELNEVIINEGLSDKKEPLLTIRERELLEFICKGMTNAEIAEILKLSSKTIEGHKTNIYKKLGIKNTLGLINYINTKGLLS